LIPSRYHHEEIKLVSLSYVKTGCENWFYEKEPKKAENQVKSDLLLGSGFQGLATIKK
jgi:hypothetical protein